MTGHVEQVARTVQAPYLGSREIQPLLKRRLGDIARSHGATEGMQMTFDAGRAYLLVFFLPSVPPDVRETCTDKIVKQYVAECEKKVLGWVADAQFHDEGHPDAMAYQDSSLVNWYVRHDRRHLTVTGPMAPFGPVPVPAGLSVEDGAALQLVRLGFIPSVP